MLTYPKLTLGILCMLMHLSSGHVTMPLGGFHPYEFSLQIGLTAPGGLMLGFALNF